MMTEAVTPKRKYQRRWYPKTAAGKAMFGKILYDIHPVLGSLFMTSGDLHKSKESAIGLVGLIDGYLSKKDIENAYKEAGSLCRKLEIKQLGKLYNKESLMFTRSFTRLDMEKEEQVLDKKAETLFFKILIPILMSEHEQIVNRLIKDFETMEDVYSIKMVLKIYHDELEFISRTHSQLAKAVLADWNDE